MHQEHAGVSFRDGNERGSGLPWVSFRSRRFHGRQLEAVTAGIGQNIFGRAIFHEPAFLHDDQSVSQAIYPVEFMGTQGNPSTAGYVGTIRETTGFPQLYNIEADPKEQLNVIHLNGYVIAPYLQLVNKYQESLKKYPNPPAPNLTNIR